ncbi:hypothetical protein FC07_GL002557 [Loigolactobacillus bifermentans DSM 20003]|uniref:Uncharacterized protein n=2 Tax=Loigolactobacillus bifermentans TaxID=1607 RepID=A0A0R1H3N1_9LACO|nr:hypothetical protein FC07_GL002557 [Loigolactobacillus bifermentans DSM 20003]
MESAIAKKFVDNFNSHFNYELSEFQIRYYEYDPQIRDIFDHQKEELEKRFNVSFDWDKY